MAAGCAPDPDGTCTDGVEPRAGSKHAGQETALHHRQLAEYIGEAGGAIVHGLGGRATRVARRGIAGHRD
jgi:hypothetical protein